MCAVLWRRGLYGVVSIFASLAFGTPCLAQVRTQVEAVAGSPFGVGRIMVDTVPGTAAPNLDQLSLVERDARALYPAYESRPVRQLFRQFIAAAPRTVVYFLFEGDEPLELTLYAPQAYSYRVVPTRDRRSYDRLLQLWWREYSDPNRATGARQYPPLVENYLTAMLGRRLGILQPQEDDPQEGNQLRGLLELLAGTESMRIDLARRTMLAAEIRPEKADRPLPELLAGPPPDDAAAAPAKAAQQPSIEPIAMHVPAECFYLRFGNFTNYLWFRHRLNDWGGDLRNMIAQRGIDYQASARLERQISMRETALANLLGEQVIADVAMIGTDMFVREGAAFGVLFQARSNAILATNIMQQRLEGAKLAKGAKQEKVLIAGREVSLFASPDNTLRSFYVADGDYHLVTTSRALVERFIETSKGGSLGSLPQFRAAREKMPLLNNYSTFAYLSEPFFRNLISPHYQVEMRRRLQSVSEIELVQLARLAARAERKPSGSIAELIEGRFLPPGFGQRADGTQLVYEKGRVYDSKRGPRGTFVPIPDMVIERITPTEAKTVERLIESYSTEWERMDPVMAGIRRSPVPQELERVVLDVHAAPFARRHYESLSRWVGPATDQRLVAVAGDLVSGQASLRANLMRDGDYILFGALRDADPALAMQRQRGLWALILGQQSVHGYLGAWPMPGILRLLGAASNAPADADGYSRLLTGIWRRQFEGFTVLSLHPEVLEDVTPQIRFEPAARPAQLWVHGEDLAGTDVAQAANSLGYQQAQRVSQGNVALLHALAEQLRVPREKCLEIAEMLLDAKLKSPLGVPYQLVQVGGGPPVWSTGVPAQAQPVIGRRTVPPEYQFPALKWLRGLDLEAWMEEGTLGAHAELILPAQASGFQLPTLQAPAKPPASASRPKPRPPVRAPAPAKTEEF